MPMPLVDHSKSRITAGRTPLRTLAVAVTAACLSATGCAGGSENGTLRISGSTTVNPVAADAAEILRANGLEITVDTQGGSAGGISQLASGQIDIAMSSKPIGDEDHQAHPDADFVVTEIGRDSVGLVVRRDVYDAGVTSLSAEQARAIFEGEVENWSELGGPDVPVYVYNKEPGRGTREVLDEFLYGGGTPPPSKDPHGSHYSIVGGNEEARTKASSTEGAITPLSVAFAEDSEELVAVAVDGVEPTDENIGSGAYVLARPLYLITNGEPEGDAREFIDFVLSEEGQRLVAEHSYLTRERVGIQ